MLEIALQQTCRMVSPQAIQATCPGLHLNSSTPRQCFQGPSNKSLTVLRKSQTLRTSTRTLAQQRFGTQLIGGAFSGANEVFVAGADGQLGARIVQKLLQAGYKVIAGVPDEETAKSAVDFAVSVELLRKPEVQKLRLAEVDLADESSIIAALPKGGRVMAVINDSPNKGVSKLDARAATRLLSAAQEMDASQFVLVAPAAGSSGGGFLGNLFGRSSPAGGSGAKPSKLEQDVAASGLDFIVIRLGRTDVQDAAFEKSSNIALGPQGSSPKQPKLTKGQAAQVVQQVFRLADSNVLVEAWASADAPRIDVEDAVEQVLQEATIEEEEEIGEETSVEASQSVMDEEEEETPEVDVPKPSGGFFGFGGTRRIRKGDNAPQPSACSDNSDESSSPAPRLPFGLGQKKKEEVEQEVEADSPYNPAEALSNILGSKKGKAAEISPEKARSSARKGAKAAQRAAQKAAPVPPGAEEPKPSKKGFLASIGLGGESKYVDED